MLTRLSALSLATLASLPAQGGSWSSGGGEILEHAQNPWFLDTPSSAPVTYCVTSATDFAVPQSGLETVVQNALRWWDNEFSNAHYPDNDIPLADGRMIKLRVLLNTTRFVQEPCSDSTDLAFQFGSLTTAQEAEFDRLQVDLQRYVALTIRTDYSDALRGKGFIYVSPDRGPNAFKGQNVRPNAWTDRDSQYSTLQMVLTHELGHVFGLSHAATNDSIMSARMAEVMVSDRFGDIYNLQSFALGAVFFPKAGTLYENCRAEGEDKDLRAFFEIPRDLTCIRVMRNLNQLIVDARFDDESPWKRIGIARFSDGGDRRHSNLVTLWLPNTQTVFPTIPPFVSSLAGPSSSEVQQSAQFEFAETRRKKPIFIQASARYVQVGGVLNDQMVPDLLPRAQFGRQLSGWNSR